ncbi:MAG: hypothetical protein V7739_11470 [Motiliproteus sp.]
MAVRLRFFFDDSKHLLPQNAALKNSALGQDAFVLATGPSIKDVDLSFLEGRDCFSVSNFFLHDQIDLINPRFHFFAPYHKPLILDEYIDWLSASDKELPPSTSIVLGTSTRSIVEDNDLFAGRKVYYLSLQKSGVGRKPDILKPVLAPYTSPIMTLALIHYMGYKRVFLLGCDHNVLKNYGGTVSNFYSPEKEMRSNATSGSNWDSGIISHLDIARNVFLQYDFYNSIFDSDGREMYQMSKDGWLDFIKYIDIKEFLK